MLDYNYKKGSQNVELFQVNYNETVQLHNAENEQDPYFTILLIRFD